VKVRH